jgi:hypothetical protein
MDPQVIQPITRTAHRALLKVCHPKVLLKFVLQCFQAGKITKTTMRTIGVGHSQTCGIASEVTGPVTACSSLFWEVMEIRMNGNMPTSVIPQGAMKAKNVSFHFILHVIFALLF